MGKLVAFNFNIFCSLFENSQMKITLTKELWILMGWVIKTYADTTCPRLVQRAAQGLW